MRQTRLILVCAALMPLLSLGFETTALVDDCPADGIWPGRWYPLANGSLGCMIGGGVRSMRCQFNVDSFWSGDAKPALGVDDESSDRNLEEMGEFLAFGEMQIDILRLGRTTDYARRLDFATAAYDDRFASGDLRVSRRVVASRPDGLVAVEISANRPITCQVRLEGAHDEVASLLANAGGRDLRTLGFGGVLRSGLGYGARVDIRAAGGSLVHLGETCGTMVRDVTNVVFYLRAATTYDRTRADFGLTGKGVTFPEALPEGFEAVFRRHLAEYAPYWNRMALALDGHADGVERLFNYGRYLLIASSRPGTCPANLQGLWNDSNHPAWHGDYHVNINLQMNYWGADAAALGDCFEPLADWLASTIPLATEETRLAFPASRGFAHRTSANLFGRGGWRWDFSGAPWLACMLYDHYLYTQDRAWLRDRAWPYMKGAVLFAETQLKELPDGSLVVANGWSPEHGPREDGVAYNQQIFRELFTSVLGAEAALGNDPELAARIRVKRTRLAGDRIGRWGQLQEWREDRDRKGDDHPHTSHLFAVFPGTSITRATTPELAKAAATALDGRAITGYCRRSWTWAWRTGLWARLGDGEKAALMLDQFLEHNVLDNLFADHPPFQIDGNLGILAGIGEMLLQSHERDAQERVVIRLLPALPRAWRNGSAKGFRARGGYVVSFVWKDGKVVSHSVTGGDPKGFVMVTDRPDVRSL